MNPFNLKKYVVQTLVAVLVMAFFHLGCEHDPVIDLADLPTFDTTNTIVDTTGTGGNPIMDICSPDSIYFENDILPILISNCAIPGCHDAASAEDDVILTDYFYVMGTADVRPFDLDGSDLFEVITESDPDKIMPPPPRSRLTSTQIQLIADWINQGALNLQCDPFAGACDSVDVSFATTIMPLVQTKCAGCHSGQFPSGGLRLENYNNVRTVAEDGRLIGTIDHQPGFTPMPVNSAKLPDCEIAQIRNWINEGAQNN